MTFSATVYFAKLEQPASKSCDACKGAGGECETCYGSGTIALEQQPDVFIFIGGYIAPRGYYVRFERHGGYQYGEPTPPETAKRMSAEFPDAASALGYINAWATVTK